jgi:hypothetical protein
MAQPADPLAERREAARKLADAGYEAFQQGQYTDARESFRKADEKFHSPAFVVFIAKCEEKLGRRAAAYRMLAAVANEKLAEYAPDVFRKAQQEARELLPALESRVARVRLELPDAGERLAELTIDGAEIEGGVRGETIVVDAGPHRIVAVHRDGRRFERDLDARAGALETVAVRFGQDQGETEIESGGASWVAPAIAFGVGGAGLLVGAIAGGIFIGRASDLKDKCPNDECPPEALEEKDEVSTLGTVSTIGWIVAGVGGATGVLLLALTSGSDEPQTGARFAPRVRALGLGPAGCTVQGTF